MDYGRPITFGCFLIPDATVPHRALELATRADDLGFDLIGDQDHPYQRRFYDTWTLLTAIAMRTKRVTVFPDVANLPLRPPAVLAKAAASIDLLSGGRFELGLGAGGFWDAIKAMGGPVRTPGESVQALEEAIRVIRLMWSGERGIHFDGKFYQLAGVHSGPVPAHPIGIWLGAYRPRMLALIGRIADGWLPGMGYAPPHRLATLDTAAGRSPHDGRGFYNIDASVEPTAVWAEQLAELALGDGISGFIVTVELG